MSRDATPNNESFHAIWNEFRLARRFRNYEIAEGMGVALKRVGIWNVGDDVPQGEQRRKVVVWVGRYDRPTAERIARILGLEREIGLLLDGAQARVETNAVMGDVYLIANQLQLPPHAVKLAVQSLLHHWGRRGWPMNQIFEALTRIPDGPPAEASDAAPTPNAEGPKSGD